MEMKKFCRTVSRIIAETPIEKVPELISDYLPKALKAQGLLTAEQTALPPTGYGRHDVFLCPNDDFSIIAAVWPAGIFSPIHDHKTWCTFGARADALTLLARTDPDRSKTHRGLSLFIVPKPRGDAHGLGLRLNSMM